jgi:hypothetical protein
VSEALPSDTDRQDAMRANSTFSRVMSGSGTERLSRRLAIATFGSLALCISAKIQISFYPVPQTMQILVVLVVGSLFGWRTGALTIAAYLIEGAVGLPVFAGTPARGIGLAYTMGQRATIWQATWQPRRSVDGWPSAASLERSQEQRPPFSSARR